MMPVGRGVVALLASAALLAGGCSDRSQGERGSAETTTMTSVGVTIATTATLATSTTGRPVSTTAPGATTTAATATTQPAGGPLVASAAGWRMVITQPAPGSTIGSVAVLCYEVTGSVREAAVAFDVTFLPTGSTTGTGPIRVEAAVGRGTARVPSSGISPGRYDVRIQLVLDGSRLDGAAVTSAVTVVGGGQTASC